MDPETARLRVRCDLMRFVSFPSKWASPPSLFHSAPIPVSLLASRSLSFNHHRPQLRESNRCHSFRTGIKSKKSKPSHFYLPNTYYLAFTS